MKRVLALVPARGGSKGIVKKNLYPLAGKPLIQWTIEAAKNAVCITDILVSSDDREILSLSHSLGVQTLERPEELATDTARSEPVISHAVEELRKQGEEYDVLILLQPTSPLRTHQHIDEAFQLFSEKASQALISVTEADKSPLKSFFITEHGQIEGIVNNRYPFMPRQELPQTFYSNGAIYIVEAARFNDTGTLFQDDTAAYVMSADDSVDIDEIKDISVCETKMRYRVIKTRI